MKAIFLCCRYRRCPNKLNKSSYSFKIEGINKIKKVRSRGLFDFFLADFQETAWPVAYRFSYTLQKEHFSYTFHTLFGTHGECMRNAQCIYMQKVGHINRPKIYVVRRFFTFFFVFDDTHIFHMRDA